jgi:transposase-like protein
MGRMPSSPYVICLGDAEHAELESLSRRATAPHRMVLRARIVLLAAGGDGNGVIARRLGICEDTARKWRRRYCEKGLEGLSDALRPGRPRVFPAAVVTEIKAMACEMPAASGTSLARWPCPELARKAAADGIAPRHRRPPCAAGWPTTRSGPGSTGRGSSPATRASPSRPAGSWTFTSEEWEGQPLGGDEYVLSADEKPGVQARMRLHLPLPPGPGRPMRAENEYHRFGTLAYLAAYDVHRARVFGRCEPSTGIKPFTALVDQVMTAEPYASARRVFWVVDSGASRKNWAAAARLSAACPNAQMVHLPVHASWLKQVPEICFSVIQCKLLAPDDFEGLDELAEQILAFEKHYNATARPFDWRFNRTDLNQLLARVKQHDRHAPNPQAA